MAADIIAIAFSALGAVYGLYYARLCVKKRNIKAAFGVAFVALLGVAAILCQTALKLR